MIVSYTRKSLVKGERFIRDLSKRLELPNWTIRNKAYQIRSRFYHCRNSLIFLMIFKLSYQKDFYYATFSNSLIFIEIES